MTHRSRTMMRVSMVAVDRVTSLAILLLLAFSSVTRALVLPHLSDATSSKIAAALFDPAQNSHCRGAATTKESPGKSRRHFGAIILGGLVAGAAPSIPPAFADVSDGNVLPQGAQQFAKSLRLQRDVKDVRKRLATAEPGEIEAKEWGNIERFLRDIYGIADNDMRAVAVGIFNAERKAVALNDTELIKKYAKAGDVSAGKKDMKSLEQILAKISDLQAEFFDSLRDVPDEL